MDQKLKRKYAIGEKIEIEFDGNWYMAIITDLASAKMVVKIEDEKAGEANGMYLELGKAN